MRTPEEKSWSMREHAYWYHVGRQELANDLKLPDAYPKRGSGDFARYCQGIALEFYSDRRTYLPSIPEMFRDFEATT